MIYKKIRITPLPLPECGWVVAASGCHIVLILRTIEENIDNNASFELLCEVISAWIRYTSGKDEIGKRIQVIDPYANVFFEIHKNSKSTLNLINSYLKIENIFSKKLRTNKKFVNALNNSLSRQINKGTLESLKEILN